MTHSATGVLSSSMTSRSPRSR